MMLPLRCAIMVGSTALQPCQTPSRSTERQACQSTESHAIGSLNTLIPALFTATAGVLIGMAQAGTTYAVIYGVIGRNVQADKRSWAMGVAAAAGSFGQFLMVPTEGWLISTMGWQQALVWLSLASMLVRLAFSLVLPCSVALLSNSHSER